jgi:DNA-binding NarL/FixJ family response regulator
MIRLAIVDDQMLITEGLKMLLSKEPDLEIVAVGANGLEALEIVETLSPDVLLLDIRMPVLDGVETIRRLRARGDAVKIVILTTFDDDHYILQGLMLGAQGYLLKDASPAQIAEALRAVAGGGVIMAPGVAARVLSMSHREGSAANTDFAADVFSASGRDSTSTRSDSDALSPGEAVCFKELTERERDIVSLIAEGKSNQEISDILYLTEGTVKNHITRILSKCALRDRTQLAVMWLKVRGEKT